MNNVFFSLLFALIASPLLVGETSTLSSAVQKGLFEEEVNRNYPAAITAYESAIAQFDEERQLAATAMFRLAENYRRAERMQEAEALYERLVREFHDQTDLAGQAAKRLSGEPSAGVEDSSQVTEGVVVSEEVIRFRQMELEHAATALRFLQQDRANAAYFSLNGVYEHLWQLKETDPFNPQLQRLFLHPHIEQALQALKMGDEKSALALLEAFMEGESDEDVEIEQLRRLRRDSPDLFFIRNADGTRLHSAIEQGQVKVAKFLIDQGLDPEATNNRGETPLHLAVRQGSKAGVELLLAAGVNPMPKAHSGSTPLHLSASGGFLAIAERLLDSSADVDGHPEPEGNAPLHLAVARGHVHFSQLLLDRGAHVNAPGQHGLKPLHYAADRSEIAQLLLDQGADPNSRGGLDDDTPLHEAVRRMNTAVAELLIEHGAEVNSLDARGRSPLDYLPAEFPDRGASSSGEMSALLRLHGATPGKFHAVITDPENQEQVILWDRSARMTIKKALTKVGITLEGLERVGASGLETHPPGELMERMQNLASDERMRILADDIRRRRESRRNQILLSVDDVRAILKGESKDMELKNGSKVIIADN